MKSKTVTLHEKMPYYHLSMKNTENKKPESVAGSISTARYMTLTLFCGFLFLLLRMGKFPVDFGDYLWAEDGIVFLDQAQQAGWKSLFIPYAGYLHIYPRIISLIAVCFDPHNWPAILFFGALLAHAMEILVVGYIARSLGMSLLWPILTNGLIIFQPNNGECYFNITNAQWHTGLVLLLFVVASDVIKRDECGKISIFLRTLALSIFSLTGPFSVVAVLVSKAKNFFFGEKIEKTVFWPIFLGAIIQLAVYLSSERAHSRAIDKNIWNWIIPFEKVMLFEASGILTLCCAVIFWVVMFVALGKCDRKEKYLCINLFGTGVTVLLMGFYAQKENPMLFYNLNQGFRYTYIPFSLFMISGMIASRVEKSLFLLSVLSLLVIDSFSFGKIKRDKVYYDAFASLNSYVSVPIQINPFWPSHYWRVVIAEDNRRPSNEIRINDVDLSDKKFYANDIIMDGESGAFIATGNDPYIIIDEYFVCDGYKYMALYLKLNREKNDSITLFWREPGGNFSKSRSLRRQHLAGDIDAYFAFDLKGSHTQQLRIGLQESPGKIVVKKMQVLCYN